MNAADALKYGPARLADRTDWPLDSIGGSGCNGDHETELAALHTAVAGVRDVAAEFAGDPGRYSDGRVVHTATEIVPGLVSVHVWHPMPGREEPQSWRATLPADPGVRSPGAYEVETDPVAQEIRVRVVRAVSRPGRA